MKTANDFRIVQVTKATVNGQKVKVFSAYERDGDAFVFAGTFLAPAKTANRNLWTVAAAAPDGEWTVQIDNHRFRLFWAPLAALPPLVEPQSEWLDHVWDALLAELG